MEKCAREVYPLLQSWYVILLHIYSLYLFLIYSSLLIAGWLYKRRKGNDWKRRWCTLHPTMLIYRTSPEDLAIKGTMPLDDCSVQVLTQPASKKTKEVCNFYIVLSILYRYSLFIHLYLYFYR